MISFTIDELAEPFMASMCCAPDGGCNESQVFAQAVLDRGKEIAAMRQQLADAEAARDAPKSAAQTAELDNLARKLMMSLSSERNDFKSAAQTAYHAISEVMLLQPPGGRLSDLMAKAEAELYAALYGGGEGK